MKIFRWVWSKMLLANHITEFLNQLYLKQELTNQCDLCHTDRDLGNLKGVCEFLIGHS